jgi:type IV secretory pathway VirB10-like protein
VTTARGAIRTREWGRAGDLLARALTLDPRNLEVKTLIGDVARGRRQDGQEVPGPAPGPLPPPAPAPVPPPPPPPPPAESVAPVGPPRRRHDAEIRQAVEGYVRAINARNLGQLRAIYPGLTPQQESDWRDRFGPDVKRLTASAAVRSTEESGDGATAIFELSLQLEPAGSAPLHFKIRCEAVLRNEGGTWRIASLTERGA